MVEITEGSIKGLRGISVPSMGHVAIVVLLLEAAINLTNKIQFIQENPLILEI